MSWFIWALLSAFFAGLTAVLAKVGVQQVNSNMATAIRTVVILLFAAGVLLLSKKRAEFPPSWWGKSSTVAQICYIVALIGHLAGLLPVILPEIGVVCVLAFLAISSVDYARQARRMLA